MVVSYCAKQLIVLFVLKSAMDNTELGGSACKTKFEYDNFRNAKQKFQLKVPHNRLSGIIDCMKLPADSMAETRVAVHAYILNLKTTET